MKHLFYFDESAYNTQLERLNSSTEKFQSLLDENNKLGLAKIKSIEDLIQLAGSGEGFLKKKLEESMEPTKILGIPVSKKKAIELLDLPDFSTLNLLADQCKPYIYEIKSILSIDKDQVILSDKKKEELRDSFSFYATNKEQVELLEAHKAASEAINNLNKCLKAAAGMELRKEDVLSKFFAFRDDKVIISEYFYRGVRSQMYKIANQ